MAMKEKIEKKLIAITVSRAIKDIRDDPARGIRNLIEKFQELAKGRTDPTVLETAHRLLDDPNSPYSELTGRTIRQTDQANIETFGINMGFNACSSGVDTIRDLEAKYHYNIPWILGLSYGAGSALSAEKVMNVVTEGKKLGIYAYGLIHTSGDVCGAISAITKNDDCAFVLFVSGEAITDVAIMRLRQVHNIMIVVCTETPAYVEACAKLREAKMFYSVYGYYGDDNIDYVLSDGWFSDVTKVEPVFSMLVPREDADDDMRRRVSEYVSERRMNPRFATIPGEVAADSLTIDTAFSDGDCSAMFDEEGQLYGYARRYAGAEFNIMKNPLRDIFQRAFPKK